MTIRLPYGKSHLPLDLGGLNATVLEPRSCPGLPDEEAAFRDALQDPIGSPPLAEIIGRDEQVAIVIPDLTRPFPAQRVLAWLFDALPELAPDRVTIINGTGSHRGNTPDELRSMVGPDILERYRVINHNAHDPSQLAPAGQSKFGYDVSLNREYVQADRRIIMGFIEPHFIAGFSGGYKAIFPGVAGIDAIMQYHSAAVVGDPLSVWGNLQDNPTQEHVRAGGSLVPVDFCVNLALNRQREITAFFCGETMAAHTEGCRYVKETAMAPCPERFPIVVTTNNGFPLDQNLYQSVKGLSAAAQIIEPGGLILLCAACQDGFPSHGNFKKLLYQYPDPRDFLHALNQPGFSIFDQWQNQLLALIAVNARIAIKTEIPAAEIRQAGLAPIDSLQDALRQELNRLAPGAPIAIMPEGPVTIPYLQSPTPAI